MPCQKNLIKLPLQHQERDPNRGFNLIFLVLPTDITSDTAENYTEPTCKPSHGYVL